MRWALVAAVAVAALAPIASAQAVPVGAAQAAAVAIRTYTLAEIEILTSQSGAGVVRAGTATLRGGAAFPVFVGGALIVGALSWFYNQAQNATGTSLDDWYRWDSAGRCYQGTAGVIPSVDYSGVIWCRSDLQTGTSQFSFFTIEDGAKILFTADYCGGNPWIAASGIPTVDFSTSRIARASLGAAFSYFTANCLGSGTPQPSLSDWIRGTYTPAPGQTAVPHPDAVGGINGILGSYIPTIPMPTPGGNPPKGITIGSPQPSQDVWEDGCPSGSDWNGSNCAAPDPLTQPCAVGYFRPFVGAACEVDPNPAPACPSGLYRPYAGAACQVVQQDCAVGYSRPNIGGACALDPASPAPVAVVCPGMVGGDGVVGFVVAFFPNVVALVKCMTVPTRDIPSRVTQLSTIAKTRFPFSVSNSLFLSLNAPAGTAAVPVLPTQMGMFTLPWGSVSSLWLLIKNVLGVFIWFSACWFMFLKITPQATI